MSKVIITGGTGLVGKALTNLLLSKGFEVVVLTRNKEKSKQTSYRKVLKINHLNPLYQEGQGECNQKNQFLELSYSFWDVENEIIDEQLIKTADYLVHLAGEGIADKRWTASRKKQILESRTKPLELIYKVLKNNPNQLKAVVSASGVGYYGAITSEKVFTETDEAAIDFLGKTCVDWENAVDKFTELGVRIVKLRIGIVLAKEGGALPKMLSPFNYGFGSVLGSGKQFMPWISLTDLCNMYLFAVENNQLQGSFNAVIEDETTNLILSEAIAKSLNKKIRLPNIPALVLRMMFGEMANLLLFGSKVSNKKITSQGFVFVDSDLEQVLKNTLKK